MQCSTGRETGCNADELEGCTVECLEEDSCSSKTFVASSVACKDFASCERSRFYGSFVDCSDAQCYASDMIASAVICGDGDSAFAERCKQVAYSRCTCCDGPDCFEPTTKCPAPDDVPEFCAGTFFGRTCKDWGSPLCRGTSRQPVYFNTVHEFLLLLTFL